METILANMRGRARVETENGREYRVASASIIVPGVLPGSKGALYYPPEEVQANPGVWNNVQLVVYHPMVNGVHVSARDRSVPRESFIGFTRNDKFEGGKRRVEAWFDVQAVKNYDAVLRSQGKPEIMPKLERGEPIELSTGLFTDNEARSGSWNGKGYTHVARNYRPDHLAILPDQKGACSIQDGCGVFNSNGDAVQTGPEKECDCGHMGCEECMTDEMEATNNVAPNQPRSKNTGRLKAMNAGTGEGDVYEAAQAGYVALTDKDRMLGKASDGTDLTTPAWVADPVVWTKARAAATKGGYQEDEYWAVAAHIYQHLGGQVNDVEVTPDAPNTNAFCPTGDGGGQDNSCSSGEGGGGDSGGGDDKSKSNKGQKHPVAGKIGGGSGPGTVKAKELHEAIQTAKTNKKSVVVKLGSRKIKGVTPLSKGGTKFGGFEVGGEGIGVEGRPTKFDVSAVHEWVVNTVEVTPDAPDANAFCPTGDGGGQDNSCSSGEGGSGGGGEISEGSSVSISKSALSKRQGKAVVPHRYAGRTGKVTKLDKALGSAEIKLSDGGTIRVKIKDLTSNQLEDDMTKPQIVTWLTTNCDCWKGADKVLNTMDEAQLKKLKANADKTKELELTANSFVAVAKKLGAPDDMALNAMPAYVEEKTKEVASADENAGGSTDPKPKTEEEITAEDDVPPPVKNNRGNVLPAKKPTANGAPKKMTIQEWLGQMPPEAQPVWNTAVELNNSVKVAASNKLKGLIANESDPRRKHRMQLALNSGDVAKMQEVIELVGPTHNSGGSAEAREQVALYFPGLFGDYQPTANRAGTDSDDVLDLPTVNQEEWVAQANLPKRQAAAA